MPNPEQSPSAVQGSLARAEQGAMEKNMALYKFLSGQFSPFSPSDGVRTQPDWESAPSRLKYGKLHDLRTVSKTITHVNPREVEGIEALLEAYLMQVQLFCDALLPVQLHLHLIWLQTRACSAPASVVLNWNRNKLESVVCLRTG